VQPTAWTVPTDTAPHSTHSSVIYSHTIHSSYRSSSFIQTDHSMLTSVSGILFIHCVQYIFSFSFFFGAPTPLVERQEGHPACERTGCWFVGGDDLTGALHVLQLQLSPPPPSTSTSTIGSDACPLSCASAEAYKLAHCMRPQGWGS